MATPALVNASVGATNPMHIYGNTYFCKEIFFFLQTISVKILSKIQAMTTKLNVLIHMHGPMVASVVRSTVNICIVLLFVCTT